MLRIGPHLIDPPVILAPMAGVTDRAFRALCRRQGAGLVVGEMSTSDASLWHTEKSRLRRQHDADCEPVAVQIAGYDPQSMADAARFNVKHGARIIDINMGCPAKKVCRVAAGSALLRDEPLVERILASVVNAVEVPVTLKMRTGWSPDQRNALRIAAIAEKVGITALSIHGRTRQDFYNGVAEYDTIRQVKQAVRIPVIANGDIDGPDKAMQALRETGADGIMIGRAALGQPWIFGAVADALNGRTVRPAPSLQEVGLTLIDHLQQIHQLYGESSGVRVARKHIQWYCRSHEHADAFWRDVRELDCAQQQIRQVENFFFNSAT